VRTAVRVAGVLLMLGAISVCALAIASNWHTVGPAITHADLQTLLLALVAAAASMLGLAVLWWHALRRFGSPAGFLPTLAWYFGGEVGKYVPGGVWPVLGRGELAWRHGAISRGVGYATTLICYAAMTAGAALVCGVLGPIVASNGNSMSWAWALVGLVPAVTICAHPRWMRLPLGLGARLTHGRVALQPISWPRMSLLIAGSTPTWLLVGLTSVLVARAFGFHQEPVRVMFAAVVAWIVSFLAVPVPSGAGLREILFVAMCGLGTAEGAAVAATARFLFICVDGLGAAAGLFYTRWRRSRVETGTSGPDDQRIGSGRLEAGARSGT